IDGLEVPVDDRIGEEGRGFEYILHGMNPERILIAAEGIGLGKAALRRATQYAKERVVFDRPIGKNQAIQHPLAERWMELEAANLMVFKAASLYDAGKPCGAGAIHELAMSLEARFLVANLEMPWSSRRDYDVDVAAAEKQVSDAIAALRARGAKKVFVAGHSQGGCFALHVGGKFPVDGIVAI